MDPHPISSETLVRQLQWRYAVKKFDAERTIPEADWSAIEQAINLTPTSYGLQPFRTIVITTPEIKAQLRAASWNQSQIVDCSHFVVFARRVRITHAIIDRYLSLMAEVRDIPVESLARFRSVLIGDVIDGRRGEIVHEWAAHQAYIALGNLMTSAALVGIDTCPMEGFEPAQYDAILGLTSQGFASVVACALGYRSPECKYAAVKKVRLPADEFFVRM